MGLILGVLRLLFVLLVVRLVARFVAAAVRGYQGPAPSRRAVPPRGTALVRDRVCNTFVNPDRALTAQIAGHVEHFCSRECRDRALAEQARAS